MDYLKFSKLWRDLRNDTASQKTKFRRRANWRNWIRSSKILPYVWSDVLLQLRSVAQRTAVRGKGTQPRRFPHFCVLLIIWVVKAGTNESFSCFFKVGFSQLTHFLNFSQLADLIGRSLLPPPVVRPRLQLLLVTSPLYKPVSRKKLFFIEWLIYVLIKNWDS